MFDPVSSAWAEVQAWFEDLLAGSVKSISFERANEDGEEPAHSVPELSSMLYCQKLTVVSPKP